MKAYILLADVDYDVLGYSKNVDTYYLGVGLFKSEKDALDFAKTLKRMIEISNIEAVFYSVVDVENQTK